MNKPLIYAFSSIFLLTASIAIFGQSTKKNEAPRIKDFGASVKSKADKKNSQKSNIIPEHSGDEESIRISTDLIVNDILVLDKQGKAVTNLRKEDFVIEEDGTPQKIESFSSGNDASVPRSIVLILNQSFYFYPTKGESAESVKALIDDLKTNDKMAVVTGGMKLLTDFTQDKELLKNKIDSFYKDISKKRFAASVPETALVASLNELFTAADIRPIVVLQSNGSLLAYRFKDNFEFKHFSTADIIACIQKSRAVIYTIVPRYSYTGVPQPEQLRRKRVEYQYQAKITPEVLGEMPSGIAEPPETEDELIGAINSSISEEMDAKNISDLSGGSTDYFQTSEQVKDIYSKIMMDTQNRYTIGYYSNNETKNDQIRQIRFQVAQHPDYTIWGSKSYITKSPENK